LNYKIYILFILIILFGIGVFTSPVNVNSDRDEAVIITARSIINLENPYEHSLYNGSPNRTGLFDGAIAIPFVAIFGDYQILTFIFYIIFLIIMYRSKNFYLILIGLILLSPALIRIMYYRLDELYWVLLYIYALVSIKKWYRWFFIIPIIFWRNIFTFGTARELLPMLDYWLLIIAIYTFSLYKFRNIIKDE